MIRDLMLTSIETVTGFDLVTGNLKFILDELQNVTLDNAEETSDITGKNGRILSRLKRNKTVTISGTSGMLSGGLMEAQTGGKFESKTTEVMWTDYLTVKSNAATTSFTAVGTTGAEIIALYAKNADGTLGDLLTQGDAVAEGVFTYSPATKALAFNDGEIADGSEVVVKYKRKIQGDVLGNDAENYSEKCVLYIDALAEDTCGNVFRVQIYVPKADMSGNFSIEASDSQATHPFEATSLAGSCGANGTELWTYTVYGANAADVA